MDQYTALPKKDPLIHITLNELYNTHSLISQHIETLVSSRSSQALARSTSYTLSQSPNGEQRLRILTDELGPAPGQVPRKENRTVELQLHPNNLPRDDSFGTSTVEVVVGEMCN